MRPLQVGDEVYHVFTPGVRGRITRLDGRYGAPTATVDGVHYFLSNLRPTKRQVIKDFVEAIKTLTP